MKTAEIKTLLKKELLIIELPEDSTLIEIFGLIGADENNTPDYHLTEFNFSDYTLLGKPDEISEDDAKELVESNFIEFWYPNEFDGYGFDKFKNYKTAEFSEVDAIESLLSAIESKIYWENPLGIDEPIENFQSSTFGGEKTIIYRNPMNVLWHEAESRTFDRNRSLIFVKN